MDTDPEYINNILSKPAHSMTIEERLKQDFAVINKRSRRTKSRVKKPRHSSKKKYSRKKQTYNIKKYKL